MNNSKLKALPFNPTIASVFYKIGFIENWGRGTLNIIDECLSDGLSKPTFEYNWTAVCTTFYKNRVNAPLNEIQNHIIKEISDNSKISYAELADKLKKNRTTIMRNIQKLKLLTLIERVGSDKSGYWKVNKF